MKGIRVAWPEKGVSTVEEFEAAPPASGQLLIRSRVSLVSPGTERAWFLGFPNTPNRFPQYPGYCNVGEVIQTGEGVTAWRAGDRVACEGKHASLIVQDAARCVSIPPNISDEEAVFYNLIAISMQGVRKARIELGEPVAVLGAGLIGLLAAQLAKLCGALPVISLDRDERRLDFAKDTADVTLTTGDEADLLSRWKEIGGATVVIEATGQPDAVPLAMQLASYSGRVILLGSTRGETERVNFYRDVHHKGLTLIGAHARTRPAHDSSPSRWTNADDQKTALQLLSMGRMTTAPYITHRFDGEDAPEAYRLLSEGDLSALGMLFSWNR